MVPLDKVLQWRNVKQKLSIFRTPKYSEPCQTPTMERFSIMVNDYNDFHNISFSISLLCEKNMYFSIHVKFLLEKYLFDAKKYQAGGEQELFVDVFK